VVEFYHGQHTRPYLAGLGYNDKGRLLEIFLSFGRSGADVETNARDAAILISFALQYGAPIETMRKSLSRNADGSAAGPIGQLLDILEKEEP
jgi:hypothetical protein